MSLRFDHFRLDPAALQIFRGDAQLDAPPQVVEVLCHLIQNADRVVPRQELLDRFWPRAGTGGDAALNTCIRRIRTLLEDDADAPRYIQTRPRAGYRFVGSLMADAPPPSPVPRRAFRPALAVGLSVALTLGGAVWAWGAGMFSRPDQRIAIEPAQGLCEYVLFPHFNLGLRESLLAQVSHRLPAGYSVASDGQHADLHVRVSVRQTAQQTVVVLTLLDEGQGRVLWSGEFSEATDLENYVPLQRSLARRMAAGLTQALDRHS
ncbi:winged helix-turn-helix domain-containing protein [Pseudoxanthomonas winnipegensis]|uniref:Winged helix family transcriptional regulator n=1 Tax=Pseudoxanthomonas winnipegensis TaxID=2480810 RepID=A0A4Q8LDF2_9GAMM|nr:winged helix-turn-helix domain-containing protein [Pseudoxanthomonas winnipegensis]TAA26928.1 winged helix family transcriptional regulator [Pseudoxanthomonas winnipegensis]